VDDLSKAQAAKPRDYQATFPGPGGEQRSRVPEHVYEQSIVRHPSGETEGKHPKDVDWTLLEAFHPAEQPVLKAIRAKCLDCCCYQETEVRKCTAVGCPLWPYRMGTNPLRKKKELTEEQRDQLRELARARFGQNGGQDGSD
jgi:hypothetical protein